MLDGKVTAAASTRYNGTRFWVTAGSVQNPGMALRREFQAQWVVKHLKVVSMPGGFNVPTWSAEGVEQVKL